MTRAEAKAAFSNDMVYMEKYLENPRHVEIQAWLMVRVMQSIWLNVIAQCNVVTKSGWRAPAPIYPEIHKISANAVRTHVLKSAIVVQVHSIPVWKWWILLYWDEQPYSGWTSSNRNDHCIDLIKEQLRIASGLPLSVTQDQVNVLVMQLNVVSTQKIQKPSCQAQVQSLASTHQVDLVYAGNRIFTLVILFHLTMIQWLVNWSLRWNTRNRDLSHEKCVGGTYHWW